nr:hypothetical protein [Tanacetum cinerariifolium]
MMSKSFESVQKHATNLELELQQCKEKIKNDMSFKVNELKDFCKEREQYFEIQDLKAQLQDKGIAISELKKLIEKLKGKSVETKFEKSSVIRQSNAFKSQRPSILGKPTTFLNSFVRKDFLKSTSVTQTHVSNDFSKQVTAQIFPANKKSILKNTNVLNSGMYKIHTDHTQTRTSKLPLDSRKTNKRVTFSTGVILSTSVSRPQLKSNLIEDSVLHNNSRGKNRKSKDETPEVLIDFLRLVQRGLQAQVGVVRTGKGTEFLNQTLYAYFAAEGIQHQTSVARTPEQNSTISPVVPLLPIFIACSLLTCSNAFLD